jgi:uncharacterized membrane protein
MVEEDGSMSSDLGATEEQQKGRLGEPRWPMAIAVVATGLLRAALPHELRNGDAAWLFLIIVVVLLAVLIIGDPGRIDRDRPWLHNLTSVLIGLISIANADAAVRLVVGIIDVSSFTQDAKVLLASGASIWLSNIIAFALWYWNLDRGGPAARAAGTEIRPALIFPEMLHTQHVKEGWYPTFVDYFHFAFATATAFSPTDVSAVKPWMKLMMMAEEAISLVVAVLVVARAVNILK